MQYTCASPVCVVFEHQVDFGLVALSKRYKSRIACLDRLAHNVFWQFRLGRESLVLDDELDDLLGVGERWAAFEELVRDGTVEKDGEALWHAF